MQLLIDSSKSLEKIRAVIAKLKSGFIIPDSTCVHPLAKTLLHIQDQLLDLHTFYNWFDGIQAWNNGNIEDSSEINQFSTETDTLIHEMLIIIQKFVQDERKKNKELKKQDDEVHQDTDQEDGDKEEEGKYM